MHFAMHTNQVKKNNTISIFSNLRSKLNWRCDNISLEMLPQIYSYLSQFHSFRSLCDHGFFLETCSTSVVSHFILKFSVKLARLATKMSLKCLKTLILKYVDLFEHESCIANFKWKSPWQPLTLIGIRMNDQPTTFVWLIRFIAEFVFLNWIVIFFNSLVYSCLFPKISPFFEKFCQLQCHIIY